MERIRQEQPDIGLAPDNWAPDVQGFERAYRIDSFLDRVARRDHASRHPAPAPFRPIVEHRRTDIESAARLSEQDRANAKLLGEHAEALHAAKHDSHRGALRAVFEHPHVDTTIPRGTVVFHQIVDPIGMDTIYPAEKDSWSFHRHMELTTGDVVRYDHARSATLSADWLQLGKTTGESVGLNSGAPETMLRLELAPLRGLYVGDALCEVAQSHLSAELEVLLPAGTHWEVVAVVDAEHPVDWQNGSRVYKRLRTIQMVERGADEAPTSTAMRMTATDEELDALTESPLL